MHPRCDHLAYPACGKKWRGTFVQHLCEFCVEPSGKRMPSTGNKENSTSGIFFNLSFSFDLGWPESMCRDSRPASIPDSDS